MRIGAILLLYNGLCYQSYGWNVLRPLGDIQNATNLLEKYNCDEISIIRPIRNLDSYLKNDIEALKKIKTMTPLSFGGGIRSLDSLKLISNIPIERYVFSSSMINKDKKTIDKASSIFGRQAIQCLLPFKKKGNTYSFFLSSKNCFVSLSNSQINFINQNSNEIILFDVNNEGLLDKFDFDILDFINLPREKLIISGGIGPRNSRKAAKLSIASTLIDNKTLHNEFSLKRYKQI